MLDGMKNVLKPIGAIQAVAGPQTRPLPIFLLLLLAQEAWVKNVGVIGSQQTEHTCCSVSNARRGIMTLACSASVQGMHAGGS